MIIPPPSNTAIGRSPPGGRADGWQMMRACMMPIVAGALAPWVIWLVAGHLGSPELAAVSLASGCVYLRIIWAYGEQELAARQRLGRRYTELGPLFALAVCCGLAGSMTAPGVSTFALIDAVGLSRVAAATPPNG